MALIKSERDGSWNATTTWDAGRLPAASDWVIIDHRVEMDDDVTMKADAVIVRDGSLIRTGGGVRRLACNELKMTRKLDDMRTVDLTGVELQGIRPSISSLEVYNGSNTLDETSGLVIFADPGYYGAGAILRDIKPEGCAPAYAEKVSNTVRYITIPVMVKAIYPYYLAKLYDMAAGPYQVLAVTPTCALKGFIESIAPDSASVGKEFITAKVTIAEGPRA